MHAHATIYTQLFYRHIGIISLTVGAMSQQDVVADGQERQEGQEGQEADNASKDAVQVTSLFKIKLALPNAQMIE